MKLRVGTTWLRDPSGAMQVLGLLESSDGAWGRSLEEEESPSSSLGVGVSYLWLFLSPVWLNLASLRSV